MNKTKLHIMILFDIAVLFAGCAVLTVDVDVYKGPLANHEDIQMEQMAAMAIGAKPLLVELRDILEANYMNRLKLYELHMGSDPNSQEPKSQLQEQLARYWKYGRTSIETRLRILRDQPWYETNFVKPYPDEEGVMKSCFLDSNADHVNNILFLYEDRGDEQYFILNSRIRQALKDYKVAYNILRPDSNETDTKRWKKLELKQNSFEKQAKNLLPGKPSADEIEELSKYIENLRSNYEYFCTNKKRDATKLFISWHTIRNKLGEKVPYALRDNRLLKGKDDELQESPNAQARAFTETELANFHAERFFGLEGTKIDDFVEHVEEISQAFLDSRDALERFWQAEMEAIIYLSDKQEQASSDWELDILKHARDSLEVIQPRYVAVFLDLNKLMKDSKEDVPKEVGYLDELRSKLTTIKLAGSGRSREWNIPDDYSKAKDIFLNEFIRKPAQMAKGLLACHEYCKSKPYSNALNTNESTKGTSLQYISGWNFGLVRAPFDLHEELIVNLEQLEKSTQEIGGGAFGKGRLDDGLETLIEKYLKQAEICNPNNDELDITRQRLSDALVRFAEKLLFVANNRNLMSPQKSDLGLFLGTSLGFYRLMFGEAFIDYVREYGIVPFLSEDAEQYTRILQAVGNSILVQADALHQERKHMERLEDHYDKEIAILADTVSRMSPVHRDTVGIKPVHELLQENPNPTAKDVRDVWIELLEYEHDLALYYGETQRAKEIDDALDAAKKKREDMIFIRPAMAYLRTSFPATSLQDNPNLTWDNMLGGHMMRSVPFAPQIGEFLNPDAKRDARITAEIDKQFWQNINRVRVAGGGDTNYAVVKDDIGNWYVKGYSADTNDIIDSAKNLAMFSLSAKMNTDMLAQIDRKEGDSPGADDSNVNRTGIERLYQKHTHTYNNRTNLDLERLNKVLKDGLKKDIKEAWDQNEHLNKDARGKLEKKLDATTRLHLNDALDELKKSADDVSRGTKIIVALRAIIRFHNSLLTSIHDLDLTGPAKDRLSLAEKERADKEENLKNAKDRHSDLENEKEKAEIDLKNKIQAADDDPNNTDKEKEREEAEKALETIKANLEKANKETEAAQTAFDKTAKDFEKKYIEYKAAIRAEESAIRDVTRIVHEELMRTITKRNETVKNLETAIMFIGETNNQ